MVNANTKNIHLMSTSASTQISINRLTDGTNSRLPDHSPMPHSEPIAFIVTNLARYNIDPQSPHLTTAKESSNTSKDKALTTTFRPIEWWSSRGIHRCRLWQWFSRSNICSTPRIRHILATSKATTHCNFRVRIWMYGVSSNTKKRYRQGNS